MIPKIQILIGPIASGKSTYCKNAAKHGVLSMNDDAVINLLHANDYTLYDKDLKKLYKSIETSIVSLGLCSGRVMIIDRGVNVSRNSRKRWIELAKSYDVPCSAIVFPKESPEVHAERRAKNDGRGYGYEYWLEVAKKHDSVYNEPCMEEGFDLIDKISFKYILDGWVMY